MKDQFGNYVVQKVLETCSDQQREMILTRIKIHLTALKKYTYGKHIVARVEKLVAAGGTLLLLLISVLLAYFTYFLPYLQMTIKFERYGRSFCIRLECLNGKASE